MTKNGINGARNGTDDNFTLGTGKTGHFFPKRNCFLNDKNKTGKKLNDCT